MRVQERYRKHLKCIGAKERVCWECRRRRGYKSVKTLRREGERRDGRRKRKEKRPKKRGGGNEHKKGEERKKEKIKQKPLFQPLH